MLTRAKRSVYLHGVRCKDTGTNPSLTDNRGKLTEAGRERMTDMLADGKTNVEIAEFFEVSSSAVSYYHK